MVEGMQNPGELYSVPFVRTYALLFWEMPEDSNVFKIENAEDMKEARRILRERREQKRNKP